MPGIVHVTRELLAAPMARLREADCVSALRVNPHDRPATRAELVAGVRDADALLCQLVDEIDEELLAAAPRLKVVATMAVGYDNVDVAAATRRGVWIANTPGVLTETTADLAWALLLAVARRLLESDRFMRAGRYEHWAPGLLLGTEVHGKTLGIVGLGRIGAAMARRARGFGMPVLYAGPRPKPEATELGAAHVALDDLLERADFVTLHPPLTQATRRLIGEAELRRMKPTAFLINTSRGAVVDERALVRALREGWIAGAGLDVFEEEPRMAEGLAELENAVLLPHVGSATRETRAAMGDRAVDNVLDVLSGRPPRWCVNPTARGAADA